MQKIVPFLWFKDEAEAAAELYVSTFPDSRIDKVVRNTKEAPGPEGEVLIVEFTILGQPFRALNGNPEYPFSEAVSFQVDCETQEEVDRYWDALTAGGEPIACGWLKDRFGVRWQITPTILGRLVGGSDAETSGRVMKAMMGMVKLDIAALEKAAAEA